MAYEEGEHARAIELRRRAFPWERWFGTDQYVAMAAVQLDVEGSKEIVVAAMTQWRNARLQAVLCGYCADGALNEQDLDSAELWCTRSLRLDPTSYTGLRVAVALAGLHGRRLPTLCDRLEAAAEEFTNSIGFAMSFPKENTMLAQAVYAAALGLEGRHEEARGRLTLLGDPNAEEWDLNTLWHFALAWWCLGEKPIANHWWAYGEYSEHPEPWRTTQLRPLASPPAPESR